MMAAPTRCDQARFDDREVSLEPGIVMEEPEVDEGDAIKP
jgi:hypothetical protein